MARVPINAQSFILTLVAAVFAGAALMPFIPVSEGSVLAGGAVLGILVWISKELIEYAVRGGRAFNFKAVEVAVFIIAGILTMAFFLGFVQSFLTGSLAVFATGIAFYISYVVIEWIRHAVS